MKRCYYCGTELTEYNNNNAEDYGLHKDTQNKFCCDKCNSSITIPNRCFANYIKSGDKHHLEMAIAFICNEIKKCS